MSSHSDHPADISSDLQPGTRIKVQGKLGTIRFAGTTSFQTGKWIGIELDDPLGKNSGLVQGIHYFDCPANHGVFVRPSQVKLLPVSSSAIIHGVGEDDHSSRSNRSSADSYKRYASHDTNLANARNALQRTPSPSSTFLPSRLSSHQQRSSSVSKSPSMSRTTSNSTNVTPTASKSIGPGRKILAAVDKPIATSPPAMTRARSGSNAMRQGQRQAQLQKLRLSQQHLRQQQELVLEEQPQNGEPSSAQGQTIENDVNFGDSRRTMTLANTIMYQDAQQQQPSALDQNQPPLDQTTARVYGALESVMPRSKSEQTIPLIDYEELRLKFKVLESKRQEDREKYREYDKIKEEAEQFLTLRNKLQDKVTELQKELRESKKESKENDADRETFEFKYNDVLESLEMMTLDKEVAEERAEHLQQEVNVLRDKLEEVNVDLDILKKDADILNLAPENHGSDKTHLEVIQLERHNERLKDALVRLRDSATEHEADLNRKIKELERENHEMAEIKVQFLRTKEKLELADNQNENLKQRLDDALGAEDLVEQLAEKNLNLTEKLEELHSAVDDLEALKELADELEENHLETEKQLQAEIDHRDILLREQLERIKSMEETNADYESTLVQFRELVVHLQSDLERLKHKEESQQSERQDFSSQSQAMMSLNMQLQSTVMKTQAKAIDLELRKLDAMQANDRLGYIQPYLPDAFFKKENDPISCFLLFKRLVFKSELIIKHLDQNHPISEKIMDTVTENLVSVCELRQRAGWLGNIAKRFVTFIKNSNPEVFYKIGHVYHDLLGTERRLNGIIELLRTDELNEANGITELQRMIAQLEHLTEIYLVPNGPSNNVDQFFGLTRALDFNADRMTVEFTFIKQAVENAIKNDGIKVAEGFECLDYDYLEPLTRLIVQSKNGKIMARKLLRQLEDLTEQALAPRAEHLHRFKTIYAISTKVSQFCFDTYKHITRYVDTKRGSKEDIRLGDIQQIVYNKADEHLEIAESTMWEGSLNTLKSLTNELGNTFSHVDSDNKRDKIITNTAPWIQRASDMKAEVIVDHDKDRKIQQHADEILKLIKDIKVKDLSLQESKVKVELLEKRMEMVKKQADQIGILEETLHKSQSQEQMYAEAMENLQAELESLELKNGKLKQALSIKEETNQSPSPSAHGTVKKLGLESSECLESLSSNNTIRMVQQIEYLKAAIRFLRAENTHLKSCDLARSMKMNSTGKYTDLSQIQKYGESHKSTHENGGYNTTGDNFNSNGVGNGNNRNVEHDINVRAQLQSYTAETNALLKEIRTASASPTLVSLSPDCHQNGKWKKFKHSPLYQYQTQQSILYTLQQRGESLRTRMDVLQQTKFLHRVSIESKLKKAPVSSPSTKSVAKIVLPCMNALSSTKSRHCVQLQSLKDFERIHTLFIY